MLNITMKKFILISRKPSTRQAGETSSNMMEVVKKMEVAVTYISMVEEATEKGELETYMHVEEEEKVK